VALADARDDGLAGEPDLVLRALELRLRALPFGRGDDAADLAVDVDSGRRPEAEGEQRARHPLDAEVDRELIEVDVAGLHDRVAQIEAAVTLRPPVPITVRVARQTEEPGAIRAIVLRPFLVMQRGEAQERLDRRSRDRKSVV